MPRVRIEMDSRPVFTIETYRWGDAVISPAIARYRSWDPSLTAIVRTLLQHDADFVDVGANIGWFTLVAAHALGRRGRVHSFEPDRRHVAKLKAGVRRSGFGNVVVNAWALSDHAGVEQLFRSKDNFGDHRLFQLGEPRRSVEVAVKRLDDYAGIDPGRPLVLKLDTQGSEARILQGARGLLAGHPREIVILCEVAAGLMAAAGSSFEDFVTQLREMGFVPALVDHDRPMVRPTTWERFTRHAMRGMVTNPNHEDDLLLFRRPDGLVAPVLKLGRQ